MKYLLILLTLIIAACSPSEEEIDFTAEKMLIEKANCEEVASYLNLKNSTIRRDQNYRYCWIPNPNKKDGILPGYAFELEALYHIKRYEEIKRILQK